MTCVKYKFKFTYTAHIAYISYRIEDILKLCINVHALNTKILMLTKQKKNKNRTIGSIDP